MRPCSSKASPRLRCQVDTPEQMRGHVSGVEEHDEHACVSEPRVRLRKLRRRLPWESLGGDRPPHRLPERKLSRARDRQSVDRVSVAPWRWCPNVSRPEPGSTQAHSRKACRAVAYRGDANHLPGGRNSGSVKRWERSRGAVPRDRSPCDGRQRFEGTAPFDVGSHRVEFENSYWCCWRGRPALEWRVGAVRERFELRQRFQLTARP